MPLKNELCLFPKSSASLLMNRGSGADWVFGVVDSYSGTWPGEINYVPGEVSGGVRYHLKGRYSVHGEMSEVVPLGVLFVSPGDLNVPMPGVVLNLPRLSCIRPCGSVDFAPIVFFWSDYFLVPGVVFGRGQGYVDVVREVGDFRVNCGDLVSSPVEVGVDRRLLDMSFTQVQQLASEECVVKVADRR